MNVFLTASNENIKIWMKVTNHSLAKFPETDNSKFRLTHVLKPAQSAIVPGTWYLSAKKTLMLSRKPVDAR